MTFTLSESDQLLINRRFQIEEPQGLPGLLDAPPSSLAGFEVEYEYDQRPKDVPKGSRKDMLRCIQCTSSPNHWRGFVFKHADGRRMLIGKDCGKRHYHADYEEIKLAFDRFKMRQYDLKVLMGAYPSLPYLSKTLLATADHRSYNQLDQTHSDFRAHMSSVFQKLTISARSGETVFVHEEIPDEDKISQRKARNAIIRTQLAAMTLTERKRLRANNELPQEEDESKPITKVNVIGSFRLQGMGLFGNIKIETHREAIRGCGRLAEAFFKSLQNQSSQNLRSIELTKERSKLENMAQRVLNAMDEIASMANFFESTHLIQVAAWASGYDGDGANYEALPNGLVRKAGGRSSVIGLPAGFTLPDDKFIRDFGKEVNMSIKALAA